MLGVDYNFYLNKYKGNLSEEAFEIAEPRAEDLLQALTFGRATLNSEFLLQIQFAVCALADAYYKNEIARDADLESETVGNYHVTYSNNGVDAQSRLQKKYKRAAALYLGSTGLLYRGIYDDES